MGNKQSDFIFEMFEAQEEEKVVQFFSKIDTNGDGTIDLEEYKNIQQLLTKKYEKLVEEKNPLHSYYKKLLNFENLDLDKDKKISKKDLISFFEKNKLSNDLKKNLSTKKLNNKNVSTKNIKEDNTKKEKNDDKDDKKVDSQDIYDSALGAKIKVFSNVSAFKVVSKLNGDNYNQGLYTIPFNVIKENFQNEFYTFLKKNLNDKEWDYIVLIEDLIKNKDTNKNLKKDISNIYEEYFFDKKGNQKQVLNFDISYYNDIQKKFQATPDDPNIFFNSKKKVLSDLGK
jgi:hypothetical protein